MPYYRQMKSFSELALGREKIDSIWNSYKNVSNYLDNNIYTLKRSKISHNYLEQTQFNRIESALNDLLSINKYRALVTTPFFYLNGDKLLNAYEIINKIKNDKKSN